MAALTAHQSSFLLSPLDSDTAVVSCVFIRHYYTLQELSRLQTVSQSSEQLAQGTQLCTL